MTKEFKVGAPALIDPARKYKTRDGREVRIYATDGGGDYPIHGAIKDGSTWLSEEWTAKGGYFGHESDDNSADLVEVKPERAGRVNVYRSGEEQLSFAVTGAYAKREDADHFAQPTRIACVRLTFREGDGLEGK